MQPLANQNLSCRSGCLIKYNLGGDDVQTPSYPLRTLTCRGLTFALRPDEKAVARRQPRASGCGDITPRTSSLGLDIIQHCVSCSKTPTPASKRLALSLRLDAPRPERGGARDHGKMLKIWSMKQEQQKNEAASGQTKKKKVTAAQLRVQKGRWQVCSSNPLG